MKKVIKGKVYDTETAIRVGSWENCQWTDNLCWCNEDLYRKKTGEFFLHGEGGPSSKYAESTGNNGWFGGEKIIPLTYDAARKWAEEHLTASEYNAVFGAVIEDSTRTLVTLSMSVSSIEKAKRAASQSGMSLSSYIESLIQ